MSITLHAATQARRLLALTAAGLPSRSESHPMDHDSNSSGYTKGKQSVAQIDFFSALKKAHRYNALG